MKVRQEILERREIRLENFSRFNFKQSVNNRALDNRFYRHPKVPETTIFSIPLKDIKKVVFEIIGEMQRGNRLNPFSRQISEK